MQFVSDNVKRQIASAQAFLATFNLDDNMLEELIVEVTSLTAATEALIEERSKSWMIENNQAFNGQAAHALVALNLLRISKQLQRAEDAKDRQGVDLKRTELIISAADYKTIVPLKNRGDAIDCLDLMRCELMAEFGRRGAATELARVNGQKRHAGTNAAKDAATGLCNGIHANNPVLADVVRRISRNLKESGYKLSDKTLTNHIRSIRKKHK